MRPIWSIRRKADENGDWKFGWIRTSVECVGYAWQSSNFSSLPLWWIARFLGPAHRTKTHSWIPLWWWRGRRFGFLVLWNNPSFDNQQADFTLGHAKRKECTIAGAGCYWRKFQGLAFLWAFYNVVRIFWMSSAVSASDRTEISLNPKFQEKCILLFVSLLLQISCFSGTFRSIYRAWPQHYSIRSRLPAASKNLETELLYFFMVL